MKRYLVGVFCVLVFANVALSHPPSEIKLQFDPVKQILEVVVMHDVSDSTKHFIEEIQVQLNGEDAVEQHFLKQTNLQMQKVFYVLIDAKPGDEIAVKAKCNRFGEKKQTIQIAKP